MRIIGLGYRASYFEILRTRGIAEAISNVHGCACACVITIISVYVHWFVET